MAGRAKQPERSHTSVKVGCTCLTCRIVSAVMEDQARRHGPESFNETEVLEALAAASAYFCVEIVAQNGPDPDPSTGLFTLMQARIAERARAGAVKLAGTVH